jgi:hypothetical protein
MRCFQVLIMLLLLVRMYSYGQGTRPDRETPTQAGIEDLVFRSIRVRWSRSALPLEIKPTTLRGWITW